MPVTVVIGGQWGDEGKGKIVDYLADEEKAVVTSHKWVVRANGGGNAGHTIKNEFGDFKLHQIPSGVFQQRTRCVLAGGMVINLENLKAELDGLENPTLETQRPVSADDVLISLLAHVVMPWHPLLEAQEEGARGNSRIGTTGQGIGPCYADRVARRGIQIRDLLHPNALREKLSFLYPLNAQRLNVMYRQELPSQAEILDGLLRLQKEMKHHFADTEAMLVEAQKHNESIILEGAQGTLLDVDYGLYPPFVTSSHTTTLGAYLGSGVRPSPNDRVIGVFKACVTRVGEGPFPTEAKEEEARGLYDQAEKRESAEVGATTGRIRRLGWPDLPLMRYSQQVNNYTELAFTKSDILDAQEIIKVAIHYRLRGRTIGLPPRDIGDFRSCKPRYIDYPGWMESTSEKRTGRSLPEDMKSFIRIIETEVGVPIRLVSIGPKREETIDLGVRTPGSMF